MNIKSFVPPGVLLTTILSACGNPPADSTLKEAPDHRNNPSIMGVPFRQLAGLETSSFLSGDKIPWSGHYWATFQGGASYRWQTMRGNHYTDFLYNLESFSSISRMNQSQLDALSPSEKYDLLRGDYGFSLTNRERYKVLDSVVNGTIPSWYGLCHGWAPAAYMEPQPGPVASMQTPDGKTINFYSSDIKALLSKHYGDTYVGTRFIGGRCNNRNVERDANGRILAPECRDTNPATFHLILEDYIARQQKSFIADIYTDYQVWNQPVAGYRATINNQRLLENDPSYRHAATGTYQLADISLNLYYVNESSPDRNPGSPRISQKNLSYTLELDQQGYIIGGEWTSYDRPDFLWELRRNPQTTDNGALNYEILQELIRVSRQASSPEPE